jgi:hypothetical protein
MRPAICFFFLFVTFFSGTEVVAAPEGKPYGKAITITTKPVSMAEALSLLAKGTPKDEILVQAKVDKVCQSKGCWFAVKEQGQEIRVTFKGYSFFVPKDSAGTQAVMQGKIFEKEISAAEARHYAKDEGKSPAEVAKITSGTKQPWFEASGLILTKSN